MFRESQARRDGAAVSGNLILIGLFAFFIMGCSARAETAPEGAPDAQASPPPAPAAASVDIPSNILKKQCNPGCLPIERCDETQGVCVPACPPGEVYVPATAPEGFVIGKGFTLNGGAKRLKKGHRPDSDKPHRVVLTKPFCMDETEVTVAAMKGCVEAGKCKKPKFTEVYANYPRRPEHPVNEVSFVKARMFCAAQGKSLPTEAQWEWAATGGDRRKWPWGDEEPTCERADFTPGVLVSPGGNSGCGGGGTSPVKSHPSGGRAWPSGILYDMAGNVWEWCEDTWAPYPSELVVDPLVQNKNVIVHVVRGGGWNRSGLGIQTSLRGAAIESYEVPGLGFRCVRNP